MKKTGGTILFAAVAALVVSGWTAAPVQEVPHESKTQVAPQQSRVQEVSQRPNILFILTDDQDVDSLSEMPHVQAQLVERGTTFRRAFATTPLCCPSRASILRGQYAHNHRIWSNDYPDGGFKRFKQLGHEESTLATWLDDAGYVTAYMGKYFNEYGSYEKPTTHSPPGWDRWVGYEDGRLTLQSEGAFKVNDQGEIYTIDADREMDTDYLARKAEAFIRNRTPNTPWFLEVATNAPHSPALASKRNDGTYAGRTMPRTSNFNERSVSDKASTWRDEPRLTHECLPDSRGKRGPQCIQEVDRIWRDRMESLQDVDDMVGRLVAALHDKGFARNTYVVYTSDNGFSMYNNRVYGKSAPYEYPQGVPLVVSGPGVTPGYVDDRLVANIDLAPTFAQWAGASEVVPDFVDGRSFAPLLGNPDAPWRTRLLFEHRNNDTEFEAVRTDSNRIYVEYPSTREAEYYDLRTDPYQLHGRAETPPPKLKAELEDLVKCSGADCRAADGGP